MVERAVESGRDVEGGYRLDVENFGPIVRASVDLRPLTVFVGPSNTGKSWLATLIYALHQCFGAAHEPYAGDSAFDFAELGSLPPAAPVRRALKDWLLKEAEKGLSPPLPAEAASLVRSVLEHPQGFDRELAREVGRCFGTGDPSELIRRPGSHAGATVDVGVARSGGEAVRYQIGIAKDGLRFAGRISSMDRLQLQYEHEDFNHASLRTEWSKPGYPDPEATLLRSLAARLFQSLLQPLRRQAYYLPADRTGFMHGHQVVAGAAVQNATAVGLGAVRDVPLLSGVSADFLNLLIWMGRRMRRRSHRATADRFATHLEKEVLKGAVRLSHAEAGYPVFTYQPHGWQDDLPLTRVSSMVTELAPLVLSLRHVVRTGDLLIIEEPEVHLHPAMQAAVARALVRVVRSGVRIVVTTHSEWFLEQIGNLVRLSALPETEREGLEGADCEIGPHEVGAWLFKSSTRQMGSVVGEVKLDPETGLYPTDYDAVSEALYNQGAEIFNRTQASGGR